MTGEKGAIGEMVNTKMVVLLRYLVFACFEIIMHHTIITMHKMRLEVDQLFIKSRNIITDYHWLPHWKCTVNFVLPN